MGWEYALWGLFGGFAVEGLEFSGAIRRTGTWPWRVPDEPGPLPLLVSVLIRLGVGSGLAAAAGIAGQVSGPFGALAIGVAAPLLVEQLTRALPAADASRPPQAPEGPQRRDIAWRDTDAERIRSVEQAPRPAPAVSPHSGGADE
ncbi:hypothetical protein TL08_09920 [Actinoalloteichus hymeniacidonis]|uniref:Uncharacterized protein n=1 Tax=Actinoalloteichus hymeniacidonis TaxID=340345 RepID=A0AAC9HP47_9PSEU|nr:hypothetical protein TL08_09920 [Actinoalloteichus hymeniacidonis]